MELIYKTLDTQIMPAPESRRMTFTISTGSVDRDNDTLDPKGWQLDNYKTNPVVLFAHDYKSLPVAKCVEIKSTEHALVAVAEFMPEGKHPFADTVYDMLKAGFLNATSVGFRAMEHTPNQERKGYDYTKQELMEFSIVPIPSNQEALVSQRSATVEQVKTWTKAVTEWAAKQASPAQEAITTYAAKTGRILHQEPEQFAAFEKDYLIETNEGAKTLTDARIGKLCALHGIKEPESADHTQADALRKVHRSAMDAYANAHHADTVMTSMCTMEANIPTASASLIDWKTWAETVTKTKKDSMKQAQGAVQRARDHALAAADQCAQMGGKALADLVVSIKSDATEEATRFAIQAEQKAREQVEAKEMWLELEDDDPDAQEIDPKELAAMIGRVIAAEAGAQVRAALNTALGRLD